MIRRAYTADYKILRQAHRFTDLVILLSTVVVALYLTEHISLCALENPDKLEAAFETANAVKLGDEFSSTQNALTPLATRQHQPAEPGQKQGQCGRQRHSGNFGQNTDVVYVTGICE